MSWVKLFAMFKRPIKKLEYSSFDLPIDAFKLTQGDCVIVVLTFHQSQWDQYFHME